MRALFVGGLGVAMAMASGATAQEVTWKPASPRPFAAGLGRPTALPDVGVVRTSYAPPIVRAAEPEEPPLRPTLVSTPTLAPATIMDGAAETWQEIVGPGWHDPEVFYASAEYLLWKVRDARLPILGTTGQILNGFPTGQLGDPTTSILIGGGGVGQDWQSGGRFTLGFWLDDEKDTAIETSFFFLGQRGTRPSIDSLETPIIARPFFAPNLGGFQFRQIVASPGTATGRLDVTTDSQLSGTETNLRSLLRQDCWYRWDGLVGLRTANLSESLRINETINVLPGGDERFPNGAFFPGFDSFQTHNHFYGGQVGTRLEMARGPWSIGLSGKVGLGVTQQVVKIDGGQFLAQPGQPSQSFTGGLLAQGTNIGRHTSDRFSVLPEVGATLSYQLTEGLRLFVGYNFLYWTNVVRPGDQVDPVVDVSQIPNFPQAVPRAANRPLVPFRQSDLWVHGATFGFEWKY